MFRINLAIIARNLPEYSVAKIQKLIPLLSILKPCHPITLFKILKGGVGLDFPDRKS